MELDIKAAIEKNLPNAVGEVLQKRLVQAENDAAALSKMREIYAIMEKSLETAKASIKSDDERAKDIKKLQDAARDAKVATDDKRIVEMIEKHAAEKVSLMQSIINTVFTNARLKNTILENATIPFAVPGYNGGSPYVTNGISTKTTTTDSEQP